MAKIEDYRGKVIFESDGHGKASKGAKKSSSMQVRDNVPGGYLLLKTVSFKVGDEIGRLNAILKCRRYIDEDFE